MRKYSKAIKHLLHENALEAYERELHRELTKLDISVSEWRAGKIGSGELSYRIHQYETGVSKELYNRYNSGDDDLNVAYAIITGILSKNDVTPEVSEAIEASLGFYQSLKDHGELRMPGE